MKVITIRNIGRVGVTWILSASVLLSSEKGLAEEIPVPAFYMSGARLEAGEVPLEVPAGNTGSVEGNVSSDGESLDFDGSGGVVVVEFDAETLFGNPFTISAFVEISSHQGYGDIIQSAQPMGFGLRSASHGHFSVSGGGSGQWNVVTSAAKSTLIGSFQHVAVTCDGRQVVIYVDGRESGRGELQDLPKANQQLVLGNLGRLEENTGVFQDAPNHRLAKVAVFDSILSPAQISALADGAEVPTK